MKEIGSDFFYPISIVTEEDIDFFPKYFSLNGNEYLLLDCGRSCIAYVADMLKQENSHGKILLPSYLCQSMIQPFKDLGLKYSFYRIDENLKIDMEYLLKLIDKDIAAVLFVNYFGFMQDSYTKECLKKLRDNGITIIEDITHSMFSKGEYIGDYAVGSIRKWIGIPDGGIVIQNTKKNNLRINIESQNNDFTTNRFIGHILKNQYIKDEKIPKELYMDFLKRAEEQLNEKTAINSISNISKSMLNKYDYDELIFKRRKNYSFLIKALETNSNIKILFSHMGEDICPIGCALVVESRDDLRRFLASKGIYCPIHWEFSEEIDKVEFHDSYKLSTQIITIPCDQRYDLGDMKYILDAIDKFYS